MPHNYFPRKMFSAKNTILFTLFAANLMDQPTPVVKIDQGLLTGKISVDGTFYEYMGIPYATTRGRFRAPLLAPHWEGVYKAVLDHYMCPQNMGIGITGTEDCLRVNVYVPIHAKKPLPVMVYIHGGAFIVGSGGKLTAGPEFLVKHDVIMVTLNYRLGALGFLCLGIEGAPGNAGLKDQIAALRWIKKNIAAFGGDPDNVTIFGHSAGSMSISLLVASEATRGLFHKAIAQSGTSFGFISSLDGVKIASSVAKYLGYNTDDPNELLDIFSKAPVKDITSFVSTMSDPIIKLKLSNLLFSPCIEKKIPGIEAVYTELPSANLIEKNPNNVSLIYGITNREGLFATALETEESLPEYNNKLLDFSDLKFSSQLEAKTVSRIVKEFYFGDKNVSKDTIIHFEELSGDILFSVPTILESELMVSNIDAPIYNYYFAYSGGRNLVKTAYGMNEDGASHGDDLLYIFTSFLWPFKINARDQKIIDWMTKMWTNFAKYGDPTPSSDKDIPVKWKPSTKEALNFLMIDENLELGPIPIPERYMLWKDLYRKYRK